MTNNHRRRWVAGAITALVLTTMAACTPKAPTPSVKATVTNGPLFAMKRALRIGVKTDQPGIGYADPTVTMFSGLDIDIARNIADALHDTPVFQPVVSRNREEMLTSGAVDLVIASYSISEERLTKIDFAGPYFIAGQDTLIRAGDKTITDVDDLEDKITCGAAGSNSPTRLAVRFGGSENVHNAWGKKHLKLVAGYSDCLRLLVVDKAVDAVSTDDSVLAGFANQPQYKGRVRLLGKRFTSHREKYGIGIAKGDRADVALINAALTQMIRDGRWERMVRKNLGADAPKFLKPEDRPTPG
jgi:glutamate transport system substrate-binding protein